MFSIVELLLTIVIVLSILFSVQLFISKNSSTKANRALGLYFLLLSVYYALNTPYIIKIQSFQYLLVVLILPIFLSINPFYYFYVKHLTNENQNYKPNYYIHFIPVLLFVIANLATYFLMPSSDDLIEFKSLFKKQDVIYNWFGVKARALAIIIYCLQILVYSSLILFEIIKHQKAIKNHFSDISKISLRWIFALIASTVLFTVIDVMMFYKVIAHNELFTNIYFVLMILYLCFLGFFGLRQPSIFSPLSPEIIDKMALDSKDDFLNIEKKEIKYISSKLSDEDKERISNSLIKTMIEYKPYLNPKITIQDLALMIDVNKNYLSQVINENLGVNFYLFVNQYRINEAKQMLLNKEFDHLSIEGIGNSVGFNSRSVFNSAFKQIENVTPSQFKANARG